MTLIDFTLSRLITDNGDVAYCDLARDPGLFNGPKGNFQVWRYMYNASLSPYFEENFLSCRLKPIGV